MNANGYEDDRFLFYEEKLRWRMSRQISNANTIFYENQKDSVQQILKNIQNVYLSCFLGK